MTRPEFKRHLEEYADRSSIRPFNNEEYDYIEYVYTWSPIISEVGGKREIAILWQEFGMPIMKVLRPHAAEYQTKVAEIEELE